MKAVVIGAGGQLGRDLAARLPGAVVAADRADADLTDPDSLERLLDAERPDTVVNCAAYNHVDRAEDDPAAAFAVNALGVRNLARSCAARDLLLVHFSSDYVFGLDAGREHPYGENDLPGPISVYGASKLAGEGFVRAECPRHLVIRTCGLYGVWGSGGKGGNFVETMLRLAADGRRIRVVTDEVCTPTYTADLAEATVALMQAGARGLLHVANSGACSRYEFARRIFELAGLPTPVEPITSAEFGAKARRPAYAVLALEGMQRWGVAPPRAWNDALEAYLRARRARQPK